MMSSYDRYAAVDYAREWALADNPHFSLCGEKKCAGFISECLYSGSGIMNARKNGGWFYKNQCEKSASWNNVEKLVRFILNNKGKGPCGEFTKKECALPGDIVLFKYRKSNLVIPGIIASADGQLLVCSYYNRSFMRNISDFNASETLFLHILGVKR